MLDFRYLKAFKLTAKYSSFSKAAEELKIAQSAVSRQIKLLEDNLGEELIIRSSKKVLLTEKGKELQNALGAFEKKSLEIFQSEDKLPLNIGMLHGLLINWFPPLLTEALKDQKGPSRDINIVVRDLIDLKAGIEGQKYDIVFGTENIQSELLTSLKLFEEKLVLISKKEINKKRLQDYPWIVYSEYDHLFKLSKEKPKSIIKVESMSAIIQLVKNDMGIAIVPDHLLNKDDSIKTYDLQNVKSSAIYMTTLNYKKLPGRLEDLTRVIRKKSGK